jgi:hypothetical protein
MAGFSPVGSFPVASVPAGTVGAYSPIAASIVFSGVTGSVAYNIPPLKTTWIGTEVLHTGAASARLTNTSIEILRTVSSSPTLAILTSLTAEVLHVGVSFARVSNIVAEVLRSIDDVSLNNSGYVTILW